MSAKQAITEIEPEIDDFFDYAEKGFYSPARDRRPRKVKSRPRVVAEWPVGVTEAELDILEIHLADILDEIFDPKN
ncbi:hypothetical protein [Brucella anthropi]|uniref:hypothetical protein n=1 Tax=Brucella anthropi TaxID=529 RepID=UPI000F67C165|nr:hypothetical protein [Brucella anthropi]RRY11298.1 hypothetical protein EGJ58_06415 [Brucella anthropi]